MKERLLTSTYIHWYTQPLFSLLYEYNNINWTGQILTLWYILDEKVVLNLIWIIWLALGTVVIKLETKYPHLNWTHPPHLQASNHQRKPTACTWREPGAFSQFDSFDYDLEQIYTHHVHWLISESFLKECNKFESYIHTHTSFELAIMGFGIDSFE